VKVAVAPGARVGIVLVVVPVVPTGGVVVVEPAGAPLKETNVVPAGPTSVTVTLLAVVVALLFLTTMV
jgi:hypothetical protein